jgi:SAM-dependent methyltransferase
MIHSQFTKSLKQNFYVPLSGALLKLFGRSQLKNTAESLYWLWVYLKEKKLTKAHYQPFFTTYFDLSEEFYHGKKILDIGCGPRGSLDWAKQAELTIGLDPLADFYQKINPYLSMKIIKAEAEHIPFENDFFDVVSSFNSLDHVDDLSLVVAEIKRVLKPQGFFLLITDVHPEPTLCEPSGFDWDIVKRFEPELFCLSERHYEGERLYQSIRQSVPFDHSDSRKRFGVLTAKFQKR